MDLFLKKLLSPESRARVRRLKRLALSRPVVARWKGRTEWLFQYLVLLRRPNERQYKRLHIVIGSACNNRCLMCYQEDFQRRIESRIYLERLLPIYSRVEEVILQGGEPTVLPESRQLIDAALKVKPDLRFSLFTNGLALDASWREILLCRGGFINLSLNASSPETYAIVSRNPHWSKVIEHLALLVGERNKRKSRLEIRLSMVVIPENIRELVGFLELGRTLGVDAIQFFFDHRLLPEKTAAEPFLTAGARWQELNPLPRIDGLEALSAVIRGLAVPPFPCSWPHDSLFVDVDGTVSFCCLFRGSLGSLHAFSADRLLDSPRARRWREEFRKGSRNRCGFPCRGLIFP